MNDLLNGGKLIQRIKNRIILTTNLRNDENSYLFSRLAILKETKELIKIALDLGIKDHVINQALRLLELDTIEI